MPKIYTYRVDEIHWDYIQFGVRVEVPLRNKLYSAILIDEIEKPDTLHRFKSVQSFIDKHPIITQEQFKLWSWMAEYYMTTIGEVMNVAMPSGLKLNSETKLIAREHIDSTEYTLTDKEYMLAEAISIQDEITINQAQDILNQKTVYPLIKSLLDKNILYIKEELKSKFKAKVADFISLTSPYASKGDIMSEAFELTVKSEKQTRALLSYIQLSRQQEWIPKSDIYKLANVDSSVIKALVKKNIFQVESKEISRLSNELVELKETPPLNEHQVKALSEIDHLFTLKDHVLLFGVTGSGKTRIYIDLIRKTIAEGKQVLYLLPEIALTTQIVDRLMHVFEDNIGVYHSKMNNNMRVELWNACLNGKSLILGARSSLFLPFNNLGLIIIDEEHDPSYKQSDPAPRYNARDTAIYLAQIYKSKVLLGTATPSLETYKNAIDSKFGIVKLLERHGASVLPEINIVDLREQYKKGYMDSILSKDLKDAIKNALAKNEQILLFQNRRGYSPTLQCMACDYNAGCPNCDVSLTVHNYYNELRCHYCGYRHKLPKDCPQCGFTDLNKKGFGTEKIEDEIQKIFPNSTVGRMDFDTAKTKNAYEKIFSDFKQQKIDILVGTQMITKGLDFDNIAIVGILSADRILYFPDFKANERAFQLFTQVAGRAGRREKKGRVIIQTFNPEHPVVIETHKYDYATFYKRELLERKRFVYPPFFRMINITIKHKRFDKAEHVAKIFAERIKVKLGNRVIGPSVPGIARLRGFYQQQIIIKMEKNRKTVGSIKSFLKATKNEVLNIEGMKSVRIIFNVDP
ncbi:MAG: primosomal protein N' [Saprospiraceae bacterium]|nr:primosomal protein N' [Bacteroidia bacterium]NNE14398.1 primosomal protein N' [Saprospiraceae bacterium]NNL92578.1 primosomal protein N' [Saprospiraceae bacterium]